MTVDPKVGEHIVGAFDDELNAITDRIAEMGGRAEDQLAKAIEALQTRDASLTDVVVLSDRKLDEIMADIEEKAVTMIALRQPMARDLREIVAVIKIATVLERIGDLAKNVARRAQHLSGDRPLKIASSIIRMGKQVRALVSEALDAYTNRDTAAAVAVWNRDVEIDEMYNSVFRELITYMMEDPRVISHCSQLMFVAKNFERIGDHATFISEMVYFVVEGEQLGDDRPKGDPLGEVS